MRHAVNLPPFAPPQTLVSLAVDAERAGWDGVFFWDHMTWLPELRLNVHDPWVLLGAVAGRTERVLLGTMVTPLARRRPWKVAKEITTLDHLSRGRAVLGVGLGAPPGAEFGAFGEPSAARHRADVLDEGLTRSPTTSTGSSGRPRGTWSRCTRPASLLTSTCRRG